MTELSLDYYFLIVGFGATGLGDSVPYVLCVGGGLLRTNAEDISGHVLRNFAPSALQRVSTTVANNV